MLGELDQERDQITKDLFDKFFSNPSGLITSAVRIGALRLFNRHEEVETESKDLLENIEGLKVFNDSMASFLQFFLLEQRSNKDLEKVAVRIAERFLATE